MLTTESALAATASASLVGAPAVLPNGPWVPPRLRNSKHAITRPLTTHRVMKNKLCWTGCLDRRWSAISIEKFEVFQLDKFR